LHYDIVLQDLTPILPISLYKAAGLGEYPFIRGMWIDTLSEEKTNSAEELDNGR
jgi:hypothetical protein